MTRAVVFPGQGSQAVGMGLALAQAFTEARLLFEEVDEALHQHLSKLMWEGPESDLVLTENAQPALMAASMAVVRVLELQGGWHIAEQAAFVAGHSLGEYSALAAAGSLTVADTARLLKIRGRAMQKAVPVGEGAMAALLGIDIEAARAIAQEAANSAADLGAEGDVCSAANDNAPGQVVISGSKVAVERALQIAAERGYKRAIRLPVSAPFHCALMAPAAEAMRDALAEATLSAPSVPLIANVIADSVIDPDRIRALLVAQVTGTVRWRESVLFMVEKGVTHQVEAGTGKVLSGLAKRIAPDLTASSLQQPSDIEAFLEQSGKPQ